MVQLTRPLAHPEHVRRAVVPLPGDAVLPSERLLIRQQQTLVRGEEVGLREGGGPGVHADGLHEAETLVHLRAHLPVATPRGGLLDEVQVPGMQAGDVGVASDGKGSEDVQRLAALVVGVHHPLGVVYARLGGELLSVDDVPSVGRQRHSVDDLVGLRAGLGELTRHASDLHHRHGASIGQDEGHLEDDAEGVSDVVDRELLEGLGAVPAHHHEGLSEGGAGQLLLQRPHLTSENQRRASLQSPDHIVDLVLVGVVGGLLDGVVSPGGGRPLRSRAAGQGLHAVHGDPCDGDKGEGQRHESGGTSHGMTTDSGRDILRAVAAAAQGSLTSVGAQKGFGIWYWVLGIGNTGIQ